ncbi:MAG: hypothetical protein NT130_03515 [Candidatus Micrarchaeota archaeon]|nr:hypothetical protein [Candidatus Micrarchaeota archaeon]
MTKSEYHKGMTSVPQGQATLNQWNSGSDTPIEYPIEHPHRNQQSAQACSMPTYIEPHTSGIQTSLVKGKPLHKGHRYQFSFAYRGAQPMPRDAKLVPHGRYKQHRQAIFPWNRELVQTYPGGKLVITVFNPAGLRTPAESSDAFDRACSCMRELVRKFGLGNWKMVKKAHSEHIIKSKPIDRALRPKVKAEPQLFRQRVGLVLDNTHKEYPAPPGEFNLEYKQAEKRPEMKPADMVDAMETVWDNKENMKRLFRTDLLTKSDFVQFKDEMLGTFRELIAELKPKAPVKNYEGRDYG